MKYTCYRHLVNVSHSEDEAKNEAADIQVTDGPNEYGEMYKRVGRLADTFPSPYPTMKQLRQLTMALCLQICLL